MPVVLTVTVRFAGVVPLVGLMESQAAPLGVSTIAATVKLKFAPVLERATVWLVGGDPNRIT
jgi:hypothetical protein